MVSNKSKSFDNALIAHAINELHESRSHNSGKLPYGELPKVRGELKQRGIEFLISK